MTEGLRVSPPEADDTFCKKMLFCHCFKNDIAIFAFIAAEYQLLVMKIS